MSRGKNVALLVVTVLLGVAMLVSGAFKFSGDPQVAENFARWGYPDWFRILTGVLEVLGAILLFIPRTTPAGALLAGGTMVGAVITHLKAGEANMMAPAVVLGLLAAVVAYGRRDRLLALAGRAPPPA